MNILQQIDLKIAQQKQQHENTRQKVWLQAWCSVAGAETCTEVSAATKWADIALQDFDKRFPYQNSMEKIRELMASLNVKSK